MPAYEPLSESSDNSPTEMSAEAEHAAFADDEFSPEAREERLGAALMQVFEGNGARGRGLKYWENLKLKPVHVQMVVMHGAGYSNNAIAERFGFTPARVSVILGHPDVNALLSTLVSYQAEKLLDIRARVAAHAGEALDTVLTAMRTAPEAKDRARIGFGLLDRAGYGAVTKSEVTTKFELPIAAANDLSAAMRESMEVQATAYSVVSQDQTMRTSEPTPAEVFIAGVSPGPVMPAAPEPAQSNEAPMRMVARRSA